MLESFLTNRYQQVLINSVLSRPGEVKMGVPQGSCLGPLLFILYINELPYLINEHLKCILYADDTTVVCTGNDIDLTLKGLN